MDMMKLGGRFMTILNAIVAWPKWRRAASVNQPINAWAPVWQRALPAVIDVLVMIAAFAAAAAVAPLFRPVEVSQPTLQFSGVLLVTWCLALWGAGAYRIKHLRSGAAEYNAAINATTAAAAIFGLVWVLLDFSYPATLFVLWLLFGAMALGVARYGRRRILHRLHAKWDVLLTPVIVVGGNYHVDEVAKVLARERWIGYRVIGAVTNEPLQVTATGLSVLGQMDALTRVIDEHNVSAVIFAEGSFASQGDFRRTAWKLEQSHVQMIMVPTMADVSAQRLEFRPVAGLPLVDVDRPRAVRSLRWVKRTIDIVGSSVFLLLLGPILLAAAVAVKLEDGGPIFFRQKRIGLYGREFDCLKLRSMCVDAEARLAELQARNEGAGVLFKMKHDPRITGVGRFIRRYSIDELPQLWNTLRGDMSLIGPRPALPNEVAKYDEDTRRRLQVRPGLTGLWQVSGRSRLTWEDTVRLDLYYVDNWSVAQDLIILIRTAKAVLGSSGAY